MAAAKAFFNPGELAERSNAAVLKTASPKGLGGSNPSLSATYQKAGESFFPHSYS